jgi:hypothetical protein
MDRPFRAGWLPGAFWSLRYTPYQTFALQSGAGNCSGAGRGTEAYMDDFSAALSRQHQPNELAGSEGRPARDVAPGEWLGLRQAPHGGGSHCRGAAAMSPDMRRAKLAKLIEVEGLEDEQALFAAAISDSSHSSSKDTPPPC